MHDIFGLLKKIVPNGVIELERRYEILKGVGRYQPIGRRKLATTLELPERILRSDTEFLKDGGFIEVSGSGMTITREGEKLLDGLSEIISSLKGMKDLETKLRDLLEDVKVIVVEGNADISDDAKGDIGKAAAAVLLNSLKDNDIIAITGGTTVAHMVEQCKEDVNSNHDILVIPARGGLGTRVEYQANILASTLAKKLNGSYKLLNVPDHLSRKALESVQKEPEIDAIKRYLNNPNAIVFGIGDAIKLANQRKLSDTLIDFLKRKEAVAEAFGYYFNEQGQIVYRSRTIGINLDKIKDHKTIALAGGTSKAKAILALKKYLKGGVLVIDEGAAKEIIAICNS
ncbi:sugar-binding transcriptional regulator [Vallitalea okinawensis]|uniref:sugar-binding transcriptional regulator n=1 Tax=Vallitalea okinawensis TaxID=2078660 RepID=UPI000CFDA146|nr:sugar-binding domain-containing protein [Vallitalea okinawensis]